MIKYFLYKTLQEKKEKELKNNNRISGNVYNVAINLLEKTENIKTVKEKLQENLINAVKNKQHLTQYALYDVLKLIDNVT